MRNFILMLVLVASTARAQDGSWKVQALPMADSVIRAAVDTASGEPSFCFGVDVDAAAKSVTIWQAMPAALVGDRQTRQTTSFSCPAGAAIAHGHFLSAGEVDGPSDEDVAVVRKLHIPVAVIVVIDRLKQYHFRFYSGAE